MTPERTELRRLVSELDDLQRELGAREAHETWESRPPRAVAEIVADVEMLASALKGWIAQARGA